MNNSKTTTTESKVANTIVPVAGSHFKSEEINQPALAQMIVSLQSNLRHAKADVKTRGEVAGTTKKPWRQKGTGRARVGTRRNPIWRGGGVAFGPSNERNWYRKVNQKSKFPALMWALSQKANSGEVLEIKTMPKFSKTKEVAMFLKDHISYKSNLLVLPAKDESLMKLINNIANITVSLAPNFNLLDALKYRNIIFLPQALDIVTGNVTDTKNE